MANNRIGGTLYFYVGSNSVQVRGNWTVQPSKYKIDEVAGTNIADCGFTVCPVLPYAKGDFTTTPGVKVSDLQYLLGQTVTLFLANGSTFVLTDAWASPAVEINTVEGRYAVKINCLTCVET